MTNKALVHKPHDDVLLLKSSVAMPLMKLPATTTALRTSRGVVLISPGKNIADFESELSAFGRVTDIVAPNLFHHLSIHRAQNLYSQATLWGVLGFREKRQDLSWDKILSEKTWTYQDEIEAIDIKGAPVATETVFFHKSSKTLVVTDLFFNLLNAKGLGSWIILNLFGTYRRFGVSKFYLKLAKDREAFKKSLAKVAALDFDKIVMAHGEPVTENARALFERALQERGLK